MLNKGRMEESQKIISRKYRQFQYVQFRILFAERCAVRFGVFRAIHLILNNRIEFDEQAEDGETSSILKNFKKRDGMPLQVSISLS